MIIPTFNRSNLVRRAANSVLAQTLGDFELIVVDDHSPVPASEALAGIPDARLHIIRHETNKGGPAARNTGILQSRAGLIALLDDDDEFLPDHLEKLLAKLAVCSAKTGVIHGGIRFLDPDGKVIRESIPSLRGNIRSNLLRGEKDSNVMGLIRRECFAHAGMFDETLASCQDWDMWLRISEWFEFDFIPDIVAVYHCHNTQLSNSLNTLIKGRTRMVEKHRVLFAQDPQVLLIHLKRLGKLNARKGNWNEAWRRFTEAANVDKREWLKIAAWVLFEYPVLLMRKESYGV